MIANEFSRYRAMVAEQSAKLLPSEGSQGAWSGIVSAARLLLTDDRSLYPGLVEGFSALARGGGQTLADPAGHRRDVYHPLALHLCLAAFKQRFETLPVELWGKCEDLIPAALEPARVVEEYTDKTPSAELAAVSLWRALCIFDQAATLARDVDVEMIDGIVGAILAQPRHQGALTQMKEGESLDAWTYRELAGLHALANLALGRRNNAWAKRVEEAAKYHLEHTQPDHFTTQPWGVFAFLWSPATRSFAEQQLHDVAAAPAPGSGPAPGSESNAASGTSGGGGLIAGLLLADAANALQTFV